MSSTHVFVTKMKHYHANRIGFVFTLMLAMCVHARAAEPDESWQLKLQTTVVYQHKPGFSAAYSGANSLSTHREDSHTATATLYAGYRPWASGELYFNPEMALGVPFSDLKGVGGFTNREIARTPGP